MEKPVIFIAGMATGVLTVYLVAKALRPTIKEKLADIAAVNIVRGAQSANIPAELLPPQDTLKRVLLYPAIDDALRAAWI